jgi:hypothetical protein
MGMRVVKMGIVNKLVHQWVLAKKGKRGQSIHSRKMEMVGPFCLHLRRNLASPTSKSSSILL